MKLKTKIITYVSSVLVILVFTIAIVVFWIIQPLRLQTFMRSTMLKIASGISYEIGTELQTDDSVRFTKISRRLLRQEDVYGIAVYDHVGRLHFSSEFKKVLVPELSSEHSQTLYHDHQPLFQQERIDNQPVLTLLYPVRLDKKAIVGVLQLTFTLESIQQYRKESLSASLLACAIGLCVLVILVYYLLSSLFSRIRAVITKMKTIIKGQDLTQRVLVCSSDEIGELGDVFNQMVEHLLQLTREIQGAGSRVTASTEQIVNVAKLQLETAEELMLSVEEAREGVGEFKQLSDHISEETGIVLTNAEYTLKNTVKGVEVVEELVIDMNEVDEISRESVRQIHLLIEKAQQITEIITMIEEITANTKLIAFNATIEAARAGESGKGFSVVANEIRNLVDSVGMATDNIRSIIRDMQEATSLSAEIEAHEKEKVERGLQSVRRTKGHLDTVLKMLDDTVDYARDISRVAEEQRASTIELFEKMQTFFHIAQSAKNSSMNTSASVEELERLAEEMQTTVERFILE
ncbi:hypothetical protein CSA56_14425 [candidate division KSB3 bacterium]|uniref:Methyl-accepting chemotaxis protein n=1 Tax=candidate division KSB3 bacterium TaxID=2044937 RepID=A0A2G6KBD5_9BACT|nr:MAG: hypothetical protein CSA56_14425 [candidate division KSB3 bacterium]